MVWGLWNKEFTSSWHYFEAGRADQSSCLSDQHTNTKMDSEKRSLLNQRMFRHPAKSKQGPYLPALSGWISWTAWTCPSDSLSSADRADGTHASHFWLWCPPWGRPQTSNLWGAVSPHTPWGSNWSPRGLSGDSGPTCRLLLSRTREGQPGKASQGLQHNRQSVFQTARS